jgi:hypothetical protein
VHSLPGLQAAQAAPPLPQSALAVPGRQTFPAQQPFGQLFASHLQLPLTHSCPDAQATHAAPSVPHSAFVVDFTQVVPLQHPVAQSAAAQYATHA